MLNKIKSKKGSFYLDKGCLFQEMSKCKETKTTETSATNEQLVSFRYFFSQIPSNGRAFAFRTLN